MSGDTQDDLFAEIYERLRGLARREMQGERGAHTLQPTALVNEVYVRLRTEDESKWNDKEHFYRTAAKTIRRVLVDHARSRGRAKRGGGRRQVTLDASLVASSATSVDVVELDDALEQLAGIDSRAAKVVELRFLCGLEETETASVLRVSKRTVATDWRFACAWLKQRLTEERQEE